jgi:hypothetical protein
MDRRTVVTALASAPVMAACKTENVPSEPLAKGQDVVLGIHALGFPWRTRDPFLFCVHHDDAYPAGNAELGPATSLSGRNIGMDFEGIDGWRMYHGDVVPGFPQHPHRGFETVTVARRGLIDHSDSLGAAARYGSGDVQWLTAGKGIVHAEMFPLLDRNGPNPLELFQIWLNLPRADKLVDPYFTMLWSADIPRVRIGKEGDPATEVTVVAGLLEGHRPPPPPPSSWAARPDSDVAIWCIRLEPGASWMLPPARQPEAVRTLISWAFSHEEFRTVRAETDDDNFASIRVMEKNGLLHVGKGTEDGEVRYAISRDTSVCAKRIIGPGCRKSHRACRVRSTNSGR